MQDGKPLRWPIGCALDNLVGRQVLGVRRRGKYLLIDLDQGMLLLHRGCQAAWLLPKYWCHAVCMTILNYQTSQGVCVYDPRVLVQWSMPPIKNAPAHKLLRHWGMERMR